MRLSFVLFLASALTVSSLATAQPAVVSPVVEQRIKKALVTHAPSLPVPTAIRPTPVKGLLELTFPGEIRYTDESGTYLIEGSLIDLAKKENLTRKRVADNARVDWRDLPHSQAMKNRVIGDGSRRIFVFADPQCGYCKRAEKTFTEMRNLTVYTAVLPILGPESTDLAKDIACADNPSVAWNKWMVDQVAPPKAPASCTAAADKVVQFAKARGIHGTPAIYLEDGTQLPGAIPAADLEAALGRVVRR